MVLRGNKIAKPSQRREERCIRVDPTPPPTNVLLQVVKVKNSRGGQEGSDSPGVAAAESAEPVSLCYLVRSGLRIKESRESPEN